MRRDIVLIVIIIAGFASATIMALMGQGMLAIIALITVWFSILIV